MAKFAEWALIGLGVLVLMGFAYVGVIAWLLGTFSPCR